MMESRTTAPSSTMTPDPRNGTRNLAVDLISGTDNGLGRWAFRSYVLRLDTILLGVDLPEFLIEVELRNQIDKLHIGFPIRTKRSYILPVAVELISEKSLAVLVAIRNDMLSKVAVALILKSCKCGRRKGSEHNPDCSRRCTAGSGRWHSQYLNTIHCCHSFIRRKYRYSAVVPSRSHGIPIPMWEFNARG